MKNNINIDQQEWEEIERFLSGDMLPQEQAAFSEKLEKDPQLRQKLEQARLFMTGIRETVLQDKMNHWHRQMVPAAASRRKPMRTWLVAAASIIIIVSAALFFMISGRNNESLFAQYFEPDPGLATAMSVSEDYDFNRGMIDYKTGNYKNAIELWNKLLLTRPGNDTLHYFTGLAHLASGNEDSASFHLNITAEKENSAFVSDASWYLALILIKQDRTSEAISYLNQTNHPRKEELLSKLKKQSR